MRRSIVCSEGLGFWKKLEGTENGETVTIVTGPAKVAGLLCDSCGRPIDLDEQISCVSVSTARTPYSPWESEYVKLPRDRYTVACAIVCRLGLHVAPPETIDDPDAEVAFVGRVLLEEGCTPDVFQLLDEKPGNSIWGGYEGLHGEWHHRLRRFRNKAPRELFNSALGHKP